MCVVTTLLENEVDCCSLKDVLVFFLLLTIPPCGFQGVTPTIIFLHGDAVSYRLHM